MADVLIILMAGLATMTPIWLARRHGMLPLVSPLHFVGYFCAAGFLVKALVYPHFPDWAFYRRFVEDPDAGLIGASYLTAFVLAICLGYRIAVPVVSGGPSRLDSEDAITAVKNRHLLFVIAIAVAALTYVAILRARGIDALTPDLLQQLNKDKQINVNADGVGATLAGVKSFFVIPKCAFVLLLGNGLIRSDKVALLQAVFLGALLLLVALVSGDRFELVELFAYGTITYVIVGGRAHGAAWATVVVAAGLVFGLSAYMTTLRGSEAGLLHQLVGSTYFLDLNAAVLVNAHVTPDMQLWGQSYGWWSFGWVPRSIWPEKPAIDLGVYLKRDVLGVMTGGAFNVTGPGEAYINFGSWGVLVGVALGALYRWLEVALLSFGPRGALTQFLVYPLIFYPFVQATLQSSMSAYVVGAAAQLVLVLLVVRLCRPSRKASGRWGLQHAV
ncbi:oligosaccharide repeat unit polymerase [Yoonia litorea]|uniref:Oligosaccharide repeat unit polymerase n=1 Tax=Yoonia litorea TaxID=1123755 RepID=A0A1I6LDV0_9RHOB|nr:oligosaccharide repeat unit polymerase [Yoonia litorea]SFS01607.1 hypothetical protein SAMN05444714_0434 [Yoonia litorea]